VAPLVVVGLCAVVAFLFRGTTLRTRRSPGTEEAVGGGGGLPPVPDPDLVPDTVPPEWVDAYRSDDGG